ncbi:MAG: RND family transporter [Haloarculaceae archaeon]
MDHQRFIDRLNETIVDRTGWVIVAFLALTVVFGLGLGNVGTSAGTSQFTTGLPAEEAYQQVNEDFSPAFSTDTGSTQLIQRSQNVLSKPSLLTMLRTEKRLRDHPELRVSATTSVADSVATQLDPSASSLTEEIDAVEEATPAEIDAAVDRAAARDPSFASRLSNDFNRQSASASATIGVVTHSVPAGVSTSAGQGGTSPLTPLQTRSAFVVDSVGQSITVFGSGIISAEFSNVIVDSLLIVVPAAVIFITFFLIIAYRDLVDLLAGIFSLVMAVVWTFGFMGLASIPFSQMLIAVPPLLLAVGIDFGIHAVNRYREERAHDRPVGESMLITTNQLFVAFFIVTGTTVIGFAANFTSALGPIKDFGLVASIGITFTFLIFGIFLPALKVWIDRRREEYPIPTMSQTPLGSEGSRLSAVLRGGVVVAERAPAAFLVAVLLLSVVAGFYATGVSTSFAQEDFLPPEHNPDWMMQLPEPFKPHTYSVTATTNYLEDHFGTIQSSTATIYVQGPMERDSALDSIYRAGEDPPDSFVTDGRHADSQSIVTVIQSYADRDPQFAQLVARNDPDGDGIPDDNLGAVYDALLSSPARDRALQFMTEDRRSARVVYDVKADASQDAVTADARKLADDYRMDAVATGQTVVFQAVSNVILSSAMRSLLVALAGSTVFLVLVYWLIEGEATLGVANVIPILVTVALLAGTMRLVDIPFNAITATILAITIGLGIDYSVHVVHRFADERRERALMPALDRTVRGTGGALMSSMFTTVFGIGVLALALFPAIGQFGVLTGLSIVYAFLTSLFVLPAVLVLWDRYVPHDLGAASPELGPQTATGTPSVESGSDAESPPED